MEIRFLFKEHSFGINVVSKFTCFVGNNSGEGKTELFQLIEDSIQNASLQIQSPVPVSIATPATIEALLELPTRHIFIMDEFAVLRQGILRKIQNSQHLFICITRGLPLRISFSYYGIYHILRTKDFFEVIPANELNVVKNIPNDIDLIVTEACEGESEYQMIANYGIKNIKAVKGRDRIHRALEKNKKQLVLVDLSNIGKAYSILRKDCRAGNVYLYDYNETCGDVHLRTSI